MVEPLILSFFLSLRKLYQFIMIKIGVSACFMYPDPSRIVFGHKTLTYLEKDMSRYLSRPGVFPILIPDLPENELFPFLSEMDGFVFQGGSDLAPETYNEVPIIEGKWAGDPHRDAYELKIMEYAIRNDKPVYAICRGFQLMNVYFGGTLYQDIETQVEDSPSHRDAMRYDQLNHEIDLIPGSWMDRFFEDHDNRTVNTIHHQSIKTLGKGLAVQAVSKPDRLIEAFVWEGAEPGKVFGVQWHPEFCYNSQVPLLEMESLYSHFLEFCKS